MCPPPPPPSFCALFGKGLRWTVGSRVMLPSTHTRCFSERILLTAPLHRQAVVKELRKEGQIDAAAAASTMAAAARRR